MNKEAAFLLLLLIVWIGVPCSYGYVHATAALQEFVNEVLVGFAYVAGFVVLLMLFLSNSKWW